MNWNRTTNWYQGAILSAENYNKFMQDHGFDGVLAISHDCDIANSPQVEPLIDFIPIKHVGNGEGNHKYGKNPRILHLPLFYKEDRIFVELVATKRISISKDEILVTNPSTEYKLCSESPEILKSWLSARYNRHALPNNLVERIRPIMDFIEKELKKELDTIIGLWIDYQPRDEQNEDEPYELWLNFVYTNNDENALEAATQLTTKINSKFSQIISKGLNDKIYLVTCDKYSESEFTLFDMRNNFLYRYDYLSYRTSPPQALLLKLRNYFTTTLWGICVFEYDIVIHRRTFVVDSCDKNYDKINWLFLH